MEGRLSRMMQRLHRVGSNRLADAIGSFQTTGQPLVEGLTLLVDRNLEMEGAGGRFPSQAVGISWYKTDLATADRGDLFIIGSEQLLVEKLIADDGHMLTAACMVQP